LAEPSYAGEDSIGGFSPHERLRCGIGLFDIGPDGGFSTKLHIRADANGLPLAFALTGGERHDLTAVPELLDGVRLARTLVIADRGYDADRLRSHLLLRGALPVIPAKQNRREPMAHDEAAYRTRNCVERLVSKLKQFRRVATRYDQTAASFLAFVELAALRIWTKYLHAP
jgi:transposase